MLGFVFAKIFAEPVIEKAIDYESGRDSILAALNRAAGRPVASDGPEIFSRTIQSTVGIATGIIGFGTAMGAIVGVAYLLMHGRFDTRPRQLVWMIAAFGFFGVFVLPYVKYPANPPAIGHDFTITTRGHLYLTMVAGSLILLGAAVYLARRLMRRFDVLPAILMAGLAFFVAYGLLIGLLPSLGNLSANVAHANQFGYGRAATETPQPRHQHPEPPAHGPRQDDQDRRDRLSRFRSRRPVEIPLVLAARPAADLDGCGAHLRRTARAFPLRRPQDSHCSQLSAGARIRRLGRTVLGTLARRA